MMKRASAIESHNLELRRTYDIWQHKPLIRRVYHDFYSLVQKSLTKNACGSIVELGAGFAGLKTLEPTCISTDCFPTPWIDQTENAYSLSFTDEGVSNIVMVDVFHHLEFPGDALAECLRVLSPGGRLLIFEPDIGLLGWLVYGLFHHEPLGIWQAIRWNCESSTPNRSHYYAAQANAHRIFVRDKYKHLLAEWQPIIVKRFASISYVMSGGFRKQQLYPVAGHRIMKWLDRVLSYCPQLFSTRMLVILQKKENRP